jgi:hypothetical protein
VVSVVTALLLLLNSLNNPFHAGIGGLKPVAMERALQVINQQLDIVGDQQAPPCNARGIAR